MNRLYAIGWHIVGPLMRVLFGCMAVGGQYIPKEGPVIIAANHQSYFDPPLAASVVRRQMHFFAKRELFDVPGFGRLIAKLNAIPVKRGVYDPTALSRAQEALEKGGVLLIFPEGTRDGGRDFLPPKPGIGLIAKHTGASIVPTYLYRTNKLLGALFLRRHVRVFFGAPISPGEQERFPDTKEGYQALAELVMEHIGRLKVVAVSG